MVEDVNIDRAGGTPTSAHEKGKNELSHLKLQSNISDIWRQKSKNIREYTWSSPNLIHNRIERIYISNTLQPSFLRQTHLLNSFSDHKTLSLTLQLQNNIRRGEEYWKLNVSLLKNTEYCKLIEDFLKEWINRLPDNLDQSSTRGPWDTVLSLWSHANQLVVFSCNELSLRKREIHMGPE